MNSLGLVLPAVLLVVAACSKSEAQPAPSGVPAAAPSAAAPSAAVAPAARNVQAAGVFTCKVTLGGMCSEWGGLGPGEVKEARDSCKDDGVFGTQPCPTAGLLGTCAHKEQKVKIHLYKSVAIASLKDAKEICDDGVFTPAK